MTDYENKPMAYFGGILFLLIVVIAPFALVQPAKAQFVLSADWGYPDEYGQGIDRIRLYENSTGSWVAVSGGDWTYTDTVEAIEWQAGTAMKLRVYTWFNSTLTGAATSTAGQLYQRHNVTVTNRQGDTVFSQANFTLQNVNEDYDPMWYYGYEVILNFLPAALQHYTVTITYEVYQP